VARRSIYSARQSSPSTYDTSFADFLDSIPQLVGQYQQNKLALEQQDFNNEMRVANLIPPSSRAEVFSTSKNPQIRSVGKALKEEEDSYQSVLNSFDPDLSGDEKINKYKELLISPFVANNPSRIKQVEEKIEALNKNKTSASVESWVKKNPGSFGELMKGLAKSNPSKAMEEIIKKEQGSKKMYRDALGFMRYLEDNQRVNPNIAKAVSPRAQVDALTKQLDVASRNVMFFQGDRNSTEYSDLVNIQNQISKRIDKLLNPTTATPFTTSFKNRIGNIDLNSSEADSTQVVNKIPVEY
tara:strand:- start:12503 stop:13396 length:894 start_codon:yes stop_codon:yes gene_type:complete